MQKSTDTVTVVPPDLYDEMMRDDTPDPPSPLLGEAVRRARRIVTRKNTVPAGESSGRDSEEKGV